MSALPLPLPTGARRTAAVALASAAAGALTLLLLIGVVRLVTAGPGANQSAFHLTKPAGWSTVKLPGHPLVALRRADGRGLVTVRRTGPVTQDLRVTARQLTTRLKRSVPGFRLVSARFGRVRAGNAFLYTFARSGAVQSLALTKVRGITYRVDSLVPAGATDAARETGAIVGSFGP